jgi:TonB family protein
MKSKGIEKGLNVSLFPQNRHLSLSAGQRNKSIKLGTALALLSWAVSGFAQTVTILSGGTAKGSNPATKLVAVTISVLNNKSAPISFNNTFFTLTDANQNVYDSLSGLNVQDSVSGLHKADVSFHADLNPGVKVSEKLWFEVPATVDPGTLRLSMHRRESMSWDDYLEISLTDPAPASAPMWHCFHLGADIDTLTYGVKPYKDLTPPKLLYAPDPKFPPEARGKMTKGQKAVVTVTLIIDTRGNPQQVELDGAPIGMGLDIAAQRAVKQYRFKPALDKNGVAVAVQTNVEVVFNLY